MRDDGSHSGIERNPQKIPIRLIRIMPNPNGKVIWWLIPKREIHESKYAVFWREYVGRCRRINKWRSSKYWDPWSKQCRHRRSNVTAKGRFHLSNPTSMVFSRKLREGTCYHRHHKLTVTSSTSQASTLHSIRRILLTNNTQGMLSEEQEWN